MTTLELVGIAKIIVVFGGLMAYFMWSSRKLQAELSEMRESRIVTLDSIGPRGR
ncbi:MAG: hypothetical protein AAFV69_11920 [Pseudomonadota bacterium]